MYIYIYIYMPIHGSMKECVRIQTATLLVLLWISYGHLGCIKHADYLFQFHLLITIAVI